MTTHTELAPTPADQILFPSTTNSELPRLPSHLRVNYHAVQTQSTQCTSFNGADISPVAGSEVVQVRVAGQKETLFFNCGLREGHAECGE